MTRRVDRPVERVGRPVKWYHFVAVIVGERTVHSGLASLSTATPQPTRRRRISPRLSQPLLLSFSLSLSLLTLAAATVAVDAQPAGAASAAGAARSAARTLPVTVTAAAGDPAAVVAGRGARTSSTVTAGAI